ncbi:IS30 family transposase, partial [Actinotalea sp. K2]|nr:IS30 family transposase [Actinotalea sp. K2]
MKERFFVELDGVGSVMLAARAVGVNENTAFGWARKAGRSSTRSLGSSRAGHPGRAEFDRLRAAGVSRRRAAEQVGVHERTAKDWERGVRKTN